MNKKRSKIFIFTLLSGLQVSTATLNASADPAMQNDGTTLSSGSQSMSAQIPVIPVNATTSRTITPSTTYQVATGSPTKQLLNLQDADIHAVIQTISEITGKSFIVDPRIQGRITVICHTPLDSEGIYQVFLSALQTLDYSAIPNGDTIKIVPSNNARELAAPLANSQNPGQGDEYVVRVVAVNNVPVTELVALLRPLTPDSSVISAYLPSNSLILAGSAANIQRLVDIIQQVDVRNAQRTEIVPLKHASADKLVITLQALENADRSNTSGGPSNISLAADVQSNSILMSGNGENRLKMRLLIERLDTSSANGGGSTEVINLNYLNAEQLAPMLLKIAQTTNSNNGNTNAVSSVSIQPQKDDNALVISAPPSMLQTVKSIITKLDVRPKQVLIQAIIAQVDESLLSQLGVEWGMINPGSSATDPGTWTPGMGIIPRGKIAAIVHALSQNSSTDILSTPSIVVLNNNQATLNDGKEISVSNRTYAAPAGPTPSPDSYTPFSTTQRQKVALTLDVTPQISPNQTVRLKIKQQDDSLSADSKPGDLNPVLNTSNITTNVLVNSNDILVLGGLIKDSTSSGISKIPILGDIPLIGEAFRYHNKNAEKKVLLVFIKPSILADASQNQSVTEQQYQQMRNLEIRKNAGESLLTDSSGAVLKNEFGEEIVKLPPPFLN